ncbi:asparagine synthase-related protein [Oscillatoria sp. FACHB-1406]|uniref:asparagine synthase-related protein n=1 Tax=Oscillatoria sp. FACHB-1406 TaxID=2692846 RepID=UPI00168920E5|nr:asparagine synthase-related protein [Oscillatoria sp. FACHB-1406]MBD2579633.1 7-cyano-7-deazaguanine synthase [Oscillatoria sp. FACHB-1406]
MANFIVIVDPDRDRRARFVKTIEPLLTPLEGLVTNRCDSGDFCAIWAANPTAPISWDADEQGAAVVWGDAIAADSDRRTDAKHLRKFWHGGDRKNFPGFDGFYAAVTYQPDFGLTVGADILGLFPVYYWCARDIILVGSSPELFQYHPQFKPQFNPAGLIGLLLLRVLVNGQTLWSEVLRLGAGNLLAWQPGTPAREIEQYRIPCSKEHNIYSHLSFSQHLDLLEDAIDRAIARPTASGKKQGLLCSGGLDSRMLAGFLHRQGTSVVAFTLGRRNDLEMECATPVVRALGFEQHVTEIPMVEYPTYADLLVRWEHLAGGFGGATGLGWSARSYLQNTPPEMVMGFSLDAILSCPSSSSVSFAKTFGGTNTMGFSPAVLDKLLCRDVFGNLVADSLVRLEQTYNHYSDLPLRQAWCFKLYHSNRFVMGLTAWRISFGAWPILPVLDRQLLELTAVLPEATVGKRLAQKELVRTRFPQLAKLPLDRNGWNTEPLQPSPLRQKLAPLLLAQQKWRRLQQQFGYERRRYYRVLNLNNPGWQAVRRQAEPYRGKVSHLIDRTMLDKLLPSPNTCIPFQSDAIAEGSGMQTLLGFLLWSRNNL